MTVEVQPPILVIEGLDVSIHASLDDVIGFVEGPDVEDDSYKVFDSVGRRIRLRAEDVRRTRFTVDIGTVHLESVDKEASGGAELKRLLLDHLSAREQHVPQSASLADVVQIVRDVHERR